MAVGTATIRMSKQDWEALFQRHFPEVQRYFVSRGVGRADAGDLAQELYKELARGKVPSEPNTYLLAMARNLLSRYRRRRARERVVLDGYSRYCRAEREVVGSCVFGAGSREKDSTDELEQFLKAVADRLPARCAELVELRFRERLSVRQIARRMRCSEEAVWKRLQRLRGILQRYDREKIVE